MSITEQVLVQQLARLQLPYFVAHYPTLTGQAARESWTHSRFLEHLVAGEVARRDDALVARRVKAAPRVQQFRPKKPVFAGTPLAAARLSARFP